MKLPRILNRDFFIGMLVATLFWLWLLDTITIPELIIEHRTTAVCT